MEKGSKYLNGDIDLLQSITRIIPRKLELPLMLNSSKFTFYIVAVNIY